MTDVTQPYYPERGGEQRDAQRNRDVADAHEKAAEQGPRTYQPATSEQFVPVESAEGTEVADPDPDERSRARK